MMELQDQLELLDLLADGGFGELENFDGLGDVAELHRRSHCTTDTVGTSALRFSPIIVRLYVTTGVELNTGSIV